MSGLAALYYRDGRPADEPALRAMLAAASHRGPDGVGVQILGPLGLGHARMAVTPHDLHEIQPLVSPRTGCALISDARLDNREELFELLPDRPPAGIGDGELILRAYERWGLEAVTRLLGDFAFALWDPGQQRLVCARDTSGQRCLFYRLNSKLLAVASEIQQLLQDPSVPVSPDEDRIRDSLVPLNVFRNEKDQTRTFYHGIIALPAGHLMIVSSDSVQVRRFWKLEPPSELRYRTEAEYGEHFRELFSTVVRARLRTAHPVGALLSGGLDSSSVVCTAQQLFQTGAVESRGFISFTSVFDGLECDERDLVADIQAKYGFEARYIPMGPAPTRLRLDWDGFEEAPNLGFPQLHYLCSEAVKSGVRVLLTGDVADNCIGGSRLVFDSLLRQGRLLEFWRHWRSYRRMADEPRWRTLLFGCGVPLLPLTLQQRVNVAFLRRDFQQNWRSSVPTWISQSLRQDLVQRHYALVIERERERLFASPARDWERGLLYPPDIARHPSFWPLEIWRPFADRRLHEFLLAIPPELKFSPHPETDDFYAGSKRLVRRALRDNLPERISNRTSKAHFGGVFQTEIEAQWGEYQKVFGPATRSRIAARGYVDPVQFWSRLVDLREGVQRLDFLYLLKLVGLESWLQLFELPRAKQVRVAALAPALVE